MRAARDQPGPTTLLVAAVAGLAVSVYLTTVHYAGTPLVCTSGGVVDCAAVTSSKYSTVPGTSLPVTVPGMLWFLVSGALAALAMLRAATEPSWLRAAHALLGAAGVVAILYFIWAEVQLGRWCEWCTVTHALVALSFLVALRRWQTAAWLDDGEG
jgi:uncharacterized membrane protein